MERVGVETFSQKGIMTQSNTVIPGVGRRGTNPDISSKTLEMYVAHADENVGMCAVCVPLIYPPQLPHRRREQGIGAKICDTP
jgi:hypothetical protein